MIWYSDLRHENKKMKAELIAHWHPNHEAISDDYTPDDISAVDLLHLWVGKVKSEHPDGLVPIDWSVRISEQGKVWKPETMPFQYSEVKVTKHFLSFYTWPTNEDGEELDWLTLPVADKHWNQDRRDKGGFIQEATGWKPGILQPYVYLPSLIQDINTWP